MQRRDFIRKNMLGLIGLPFVNIRKVGVNASRVAIVGAGIAGAAAARTLNDAGCEVVVYEARNRVGGRIHTHTNWGYNIELGANWIHDADNPQNTIATNADKLGIVSYKTNYNDLELFDIKGHKISKASIALFYLKFNKAFREEAIKALSIEKDVSLAVIFDSLIKNQDYSRKQQAILSLIQEGMENNLGVSLDQASAQYYLANQPSGNIEDLFVASGYQSIVQHTLHGIDVRLNCSVTEIRHNSSSVQVVTTDGLHDADYVIVTVPLSILKKQQLLFSPPLPDWKQQSFSSMQMGLFNKVIMEFEEKFWRNDSQFKLHCTEMKNAFGGLLNYYHFNGNPVLISMPVDKAALWIEQNPMNSVKTAWLGIFHKSYPNREIAFKNFMVTNWLADKYAQGSYSHVPVGSANDMRIALSKEVGRIHFAGEATDIAAHGTVHGAYNSGVREALKIKNKM